MGPAQKVRQRLTFWITEIKKSHINQIAPAKALAMQQQREITAHVRQQSFTIVSPHFAALFIFHNIMADLPVGLEDLIMDQLTSILTA